MTPRWRKFIGMIVMVASLGAYAAAMVTVVPALLPGHWAVDLLAYALAGVAWVYPAGRLIRWMQAADT